MTICGFKLGDDWSHLSFDNDAGINGGNTTNRATATDWVMIQAIYYRVIEGTKIFCQVDHINEWYRMSDYKLHPTINASTNTSTPVTNPLQY